MYEPNSSSSMFAGVPLLIFAVVYIYYAYCQYTIAKKVGHNSPWWAWIPILNWYQPIEMANKPWWYFLLYFVPIANIIVIAMVWMGVAQNRGKSPAWGIMMLIPFINLVALALLAAGPSASPYTEKKYADEKEQNRVNVS